MKVHLQPLPGVTLIENTFIDRYMPAANGEYVKVYLYLLRCASGGCEDLTICKICDVFDHTEADVRRAISYWEKAGLLCLTRRADGSITDLEVFTSPAYDGSCAQDSGQGKVTEFRTASAPEKPEDPDCPAEDIKVFRAPYTREKREELTQRNSVQRIMFVAENYIRRPLSVNEKDTLIYFLDQLKMSEDMIEFLLEYCVTKGHSSFRYIESVARAWNQNGIRTVEDARREVHIYNKDYFDIFRAFGIQGHTPTEKEIVYMKRWLREWAMPMDLISEALSRTLIKTSKPQWDYADKMLSAWHDGHVQSLEDVRKLDEAFEASKAGSRSKTVPGNAANGPCRVADQSRPAGRFNNFTGRQDDLDEITRLVMQSQKTGES